MFLFSILNMDISPESLLEMAKNVVDKNDFVNAIVWLKRAIAKLKGRKGEADELNLIKLHIALIGMLEKVRKVYFFCKWQLVISNFIFQSKRYNEALGLCNDVFIHHYLEGKYLLDLFDLRGRMQFTLGNYTAANKNEGDAYEVACKGVFYDEIIKKSKLIFIKHNDSEVNQFEFIFRTLDCLVCYKRVRTINSLTLRFLRNSSSRSSGSWREN